MTIEQNLILFLYLPFCDRGGRGSGVKNLSRIPEVGGFNPHPGKQEKTLNHKFTRLRTPVKHK